MVEDKKLDRSLVMEEIDAVHPSAAEELLHLREQLKTEKEQKVKNAKIRLNAVLQISCMHSCTHTHTCAHARARAHTHTHTHTQSVIVYRLGLNK